MKTLYYKVSLKPEHKDWGWQMNLPVSRPFVVRRCEISGNYFSEAGNHGDHPPPISPTRINFIEEIKKWSEKVS